MTFEPHHHRVLGTNPEWQWLLRRGPHGATFTWHIGDAPGYNALNHLREIVSEYDSESPGWSDRVRLLALEALDFEEDEIVRRAIQVLCVVGKDEDIERLKGFVKHPSPDVVKDAKACLFERGIKGKQ
jgi:hypothetical protein